MKPTLVVSWTVPPTITGSSAIVDNLSHAFRPDEMVVVGEGSRQAVQRSSSLPRVVPITPSGLGIVRGSRHLRRAYLPLATARALATARQHKVGRVLAVFPSEEYLLVGWLVSKLVKVDLFPWFHNTYLENRVGRQRKFAQWLQPRVFRDSKHVFVMSEGMRRLYHQNYPGLNCTALVHPCPDAVPGYAEPKPVGDRPLVILAGNIGAQCLDAATRVVAAVRTVPNARLQFLTGTPRSVLEDYKLVREGDVVEGLPRAAMMERLRSADALLLPHGFTGGYSEEEYATIFPTRTVDYLYAGVPILAHSPEQAFLTDFLVQHECAAVVTSPSVDATAQKLHTVLFEPSVRASLTIGALRTAPMFQVGSVRSTLESYY